MNKKNFFDYHINKKEDFMKTVQIIALVLVIIGALNWGLVGLFNFDLVATLFGGTTAIISKIVYILVGISGIICIKTLTELIDDMK